MINTGEKWRFNRVTGGFDWAPEGAEPRYNPRTREMELAGPDEQVVYKYDDQEMHWRWQYA